MPFASGAMHELSYVPEVTYGVTPVTPAMKIFRNTSVGLKPAKQTFVSQEIRRDRQIRDVRHGTRGMTGPVSFELSYGDFDTILEAALFGTWATHTLKIGTTLKSLTLERRLTDVGRYQASVGCVINGFSLDLRPNAMVTGTFDFLGKDIAQSSVTKGAPTAVSDNPPFDAFTGAILEAGGAISSITAMSMSLSNGLSQAFVLGSPTAPQVIPGKANLTGSITAFFESETLMDKFINEGESALQITLDGAVGGDLVIQVPRIKFTDADMPVTTSDEGISLTMPWQAMLSAASATNLVLTRVPAA